VTEVVLFQELWGRKKVKALYNGLHLSLGFVMKGSIFGRNLMTHMHPLRRVRHCGGILMVSNMKVAMMKV
jgi:hypothetical protein